MGRTFRTTSGRRTRTRHSSSTCQAQEVTSRPARPMGDQARTSPWTNSGKSSRCAFSPSTRTMLFRYGFGFTSSTYGVAVRGQAQVHAAVVAQADQPVGRPAHFGHPLPNGARQRQPGVDGPCPGTRPTTRPTSPRTSRSARTRRPASNSNTISVGGMTSRQAGPSAGSSNRLTWNSRPGMNCSTSDRPAVPLEHVSTRAVSSPCVVTTDSWSMPTLASWQAGLTMAGHACGQSRPALVDHQERGGRQAGPCSRYLVRILSRPRASVAAGEPVNGTRGPFEHGRVVDLRLGPVGLALEQVEHHVRPPRPPACRAGPAGRGRSRASARRTPAVRRTFSTSDRPSRRRPYLGRRVRVVGRARPARCRRPDTRGLDTQRLPPVQGIDGYCFRVPMDASRIRPSRRVEPGGVVQHPIALRRGGTP